MKSWMKKAAAAVSAGAVLVSMLSGCSQTIIEHQFHTEYLEGGSGGAGGNAVTTVIPISASYTRLEELLFEHGIMLNVVAPAWKSPTLKDQDGDLKITTILPEQMEDFASQNYMVRPKTDKIIFYQKIADSDEALEAYSYADYLATWEKHLDMIYEAFSKLTDEQWMSLWFYGSPLYITTCRVTQDSVSGGSYQPHPPYYVETAILNRSAF